MWNYEKRLEFPVNIKRTDPAMAQLIITQYGGPDGETRSLPEISFTEICNAL